MRGTEWFAMIEEEEEEEAPRQGFVLGVLTPPPPPSGNGGRRSVLDFLGSSIPKSEHARGPAWYAMRSEDSVVDSYKSVETYLAKAGIGDIPAVENAEKKPVTLTLDEARATFEEIDKNHDEELSQIEYIQALRRNPALANRLGDVFSTECVLSRMCLRFSTSQPCGGTRH
jgi:hypothetical protein